MGAPDVSRWPLAFVIVGVVLQVTTALYGCYKGDPGYGNTDYPPNSPELGHYQDAGSQ